MTFSLLKLKYEPYYRFVKEGKKESTMCVLFFPIYNKKEWVGNAHDKYLTLSLLFFFYFATKRRLFNKKFRIYSEIQKHYFFRKS